MLIRLPFPIKSTLTYAPDDPCRERSSPYLERLSAALGSELRLSVGRCGSLYLAPGQHLPR
ncbi:hypothetical protein [Palleronia sp. LCG004]|uniref:hypothetical protein n=1 Tax=Palleronia sp. LCG004 TaxID=3079304 RepID=UPI00294204F7|nr:hypothetical protein [Palleronia sp. LCG004]WOI56590.1 hypothetical protein RVY76_01975 [Palleronia sp. LCG004]